MQKTSVNFQKQSKNASAHNARSGQAEKMQHLIPIIDGQKNECNLSAAAAGQKMRALKVAANQNFKNYCGQKVQAKNYKWEAVVVIERHHTLADVEKLAKAIEKEYGFTSTQISVHKDEGHIDEQGKYHYNNHAHLNFFTLDQTTGKQLMNLKDKHSRHTGKLIASKTDTAKMQDIAAKVLNMERGINKKKTGVQHTSGSDLRKAHQAQKIADKYGDKYKDKLTQIEQEYTQARADLKATGKAIQKDYSRLKTGKINAIKELDNKFKQQEENKMITTTLKPRETPLTDEQKRQREHKAWKPNQSDWDHSEEILQKQRAEEKTFQEQAIKELEGEAEQERLQQVKDLEDQLATTRNEQAEKQKRKIHSCTYQGKHIGKIIDDGNELKAMGFKSEKAAAFNLLEMAKDKDWDNITLKGSDEFITAAIEYANKNDMQLKLTDEQERIRLELESNKPISIDKKEKSLKSTNTPLQEAYKELANDWLNDESKEVKDLEALKIVKENLEQEKRTMIDKERLQEYYNDERYRDSNKNSGNLNNTNQTDTDERERNKNALNRKFKPQ